MLAEQSTNQLEKKKDQHLADVGKYVTMSPC